jgi:malonyl CoA-acyl carrier protein transacylase
VETLEYLAERQVTHLLEVGPGKVLRMLAAKTVRQIKSLNIDVAGDRATLTEWLGASEDTGEGAQR